MLVEGLRGLRYKRGPRECVGLSGCLWRPVWGVCWEVKECVGVGKGLWRVCAHAHVHSEVGAGHRRGSVVLGQDKLQVGCISDNMPNMLSGKVLQWI